LIIEDSATMMESQFEGGCLMVRGIALFLSLLFLGCDTPNTPNAPDNIQFEFSDTTFVFDGIDQTQVLEIVNTGDADIVYLISWYVDWVGATPVSGTIEPGGVDSINISVSGNKLASGDHRNALTIAINEVVYHIWISQSIPGPKCMDWILVDSPTSERIVDIQFVSPLVGWALSSHHLMKSADGGVSWIIQQESASDPFMTGFYFLNEDLGWLCFNDTLTMNTQDGGATWMGYSSPAGNQVHFVNQEVGWLGGDTGIFKSADGGQSWVQQIELNANEQISLFSFINPQSGWVSCISHFLPPIDPDPTLYAGSVFRTTDGGDQWDRSTWFPKVSGIGVNGRIRFINEMEGYVHFNGIYRSVDGGASWFLANQGSFGNTFFVDQEYWWVIGHNSIALSMGLTVDGGATFSFSKNCEYLNFEFNSTIFFFYDRYNGWAAGQDGLILKYIPPE